MTTSKATMCICGHSAACHVEPSRIGWCTNCDANACDKMRPIADLPAPVIVLGVCGHWWEEWGPADAVYTPGEVRVCTTCPADAVNSVRRSPQGFGMVPVGYLTVWELLGDDDDEAQPRHVLRKTAAAYEALRDSGSDRA